MSEESTIQGLKRRIEALEAERDSMLATLKTLEQQIREAASRATPLPPEVDDALAALAQEYAEIMQYDPDAGMIRLRSDLTFASGRAEEVSYRSVHAGPP